jgi:hypothetical protein
MRRFRCAEGLGKCRTGFHTNRCVGANQGFIRSIVNAIQLPWDCIAAAESEALSLTPNLDEIVNAAAPVLIRFRYP